MRTEKLTLVSVLYSVGIASVLAVALASAPGQSVSRTVKYFGFADFSGSRPGGGLVEGTNGLLYGLTFFGGESAYGTVFRMNKDGTEFLVLKGFKGGADAQLPVGSLVLAANGVLYGVTSSGGTNNLGGIFSLNQDGTGYSVIRSFTGTNGDGATPYAGLLEATNGRLYGTTYFGGASNLGTIFSIGPNGDDYSVLWSFTGGATDGAKPAACLIQGIDGALDGTTASGGSQNQGTLFTLNPDGSGFRLLKSFTGGSTDGAQPWSPLVQTADGTLFGTTYAGGSSSKGTLYRISTDGSGFQLLKSFSGASGASPSTPVTLGTNGLLYGTTSAGGSSTNGTIFEVSQDGTVFHVLKSYPYTGSDGAQPNGPLLQATDGSLYGTTASGGGFDDGTAFRVNPENDTYTVLRDFTETGGDGVNPYGDLIEGRDGALYGVTQNGGTSDEGTVYKLNKDGSDSLVLKSFTGTSADGCKPSAGLVQGTNGVLYGTAMYDYTYRSDSSTFLRGYGHVFKLDPDGSGYEVLKKFGGSSDGANPYGALLLANNGAIYGTTMNGGAKSAGVIFKLSLDGTVYTVLKSFQDIGTADGARPYAGLIQGSDGTLYGTTSSGGTASHGTIYKLNLDGSGYVVLKRFAGSDGAGPWAPLLEGQDGALYGATSMGGASGKGTVFKLNPDGTGFTVLKSFAGIDGDSPTAGLTQGPNGILFGTTSSGGGANLLESLGTVFQLNPDGSGFRVLKTFPQNGDGFALKSGVLVGSDGTLYGATLNGGRGGNLYGTIFSLIPAPVLVPTVTASGCELRVLALPGRSYTIQRAPSPNGSWTIIGTANIGSTGAGVVPDPTPPPESAFYRTCYR